MKTALLFVFACVSIVAGCSGEPTQSSDEDLLPVRMLCDGQTPCAATACYLGDHDWIVTSNYDPRSNGQSVYWISPNGVYVKMSWSGDNCTMSIL
jgi:hypothetical protein